MQEVQLGLYELLRLVHEVALPERLLQRCLLLGLVPRPAHIASDRSVGIHW
jgi:hypothetical protein